MSEHALPRTDGATRTTTEPRPIGRPAGLFRRLSIMVYDGLLLFAVLFLAATPMVFLNGGDAMDMHQPLVNISIRVYFLVITFCYYGWFWTRGQTLGMRAWKTVVTDDSGQPISWRQAGIRFTLSLLSWLACGIGFLWSMFDKEQRTWHDIGSGTRLVVVKVNVAPGRAQSFEPAHEPHTEAKKD
jgi:uncharacterized RDD family membrane protein YckC